MSHFEVYGKKLEDLSIFELVLASQFQFTNTREFTNALNEEARRRDKMCQYDSTLGYSQPTKPEPKSKFSPSDVVYVRAFVTDKGSCGQPAIRIKQPGGYAIVVPDESELFRGKSKTSTIITLEA